MLTLETKFQIPEHVLFTDVDQTAVLLNTQTNKYFSLDEVGARFWTLLTENNPVNTIHKIILAEYDVPSTKLEQDLLELLADLMENNLVEILEE